MRVFVSYAHRDGAWVLDRLVPVLKAAGVEVDVDVERFRVGGSVVGQMDAVQDGAEKSLLVLSAAYLASDYCRHELRRAVARDADFSKFLMIPVRREAVPLPAELNGSIYAELGDDTRADQWRLLLDGCDGDLGCAGPDWLGARDAIVRELKRYRSANLVVRGDEPRWRPLLHDIRQHRLTDLGHVDLQDGTTTTREGLALAMLCGLGLRVSKLARKPQDLADFQNRLLGMKRKVRLAISHFDLFPYRPTYDVNLIAALRWLIMDHEERPLTLLIQSRTPFMELLPKGHPLSSIDMTTVELA